MLPITRQISKFNHSAPNDIKYIVIHDTGNATDSAQGNANYFCSGDKQSSAHLFVDDNSIYQVVEFTDGSWHCGDGQGKYGITNHNSIGIEMCRVNNTVTAITEANTIELVKSLMTQFNIPLDRVVRHYDASRKNCPSSFSANNWERWTSFKNKLVNAPVNQVSNNGGDYMSKPYHNGSTPEPVYSEEACINKIGSLNAYESCEAISDVNGKIVVLYNTANGKKTGFVKYRGGL
jgi:N-acetylmuramoyl-L-alanine amidase CwlA